MKALALAVLVGAGCGGHAAPASVAPMIAVPARAATPGDGLLGRLPTGADVLIELDLARLRDNAVVGAIAGELLDDPAVADTAAVLPFLGAIGTPALTHADAVVLASYQVGTLDAATITLVVGGGLTTTELGGVDVGDGVIAVAPPELIARLDGKASLDEDDELRALRARAMPEGATGAVVRVTARLGFDARVALAATLELDQAPAALSVWGDVADDLAVVADVEAPDEAGGAVGDAVGDALAGAIEVWRDDAAAAASVIALGLAPAVADIQVKARTDGVHVVALIGPRRLARVVRRLHLLREATRADPLGVPAEGAP